MIMPVVSKSQDRVAIPNSVPAAGGCSVSVTAMTIISKPTETARLKLRTEDRSTRNASTGEANKSNENADPNKRARACPPTNDRVVAVGLDGCTNKITMLAPKPAARAAWDKESTKSKIASIARVASPAWSRYREAYCENFASMMAGREKERRFPKSLRGMDPLRPGVLDECDE